ncbi:alpha/beta hydrolase [Streptomyces sp. NPDC050546]|uniref:alpha/beta hydrolase n=1 Tax=Streptomyces sp. NPDC050546 TaxID=3365628 RepID=UPI0037A6DEFC
MKAPVTFRSNNLAIAGVLYVPDDYDGRRLPGVVVVHPAGGVKEQTAARYAEELSRNGYAALAFDAAYQGESEGEPRSLEDPFQRAEDIRAAVSYLASRSDIDHERVGALGICAGGSYLSYAAQTDRRIKAVATVSAVDPAGELLADPATRDALLDQAGVLRNVEARGEGAFAGNQLPPTKADADAFPARSMFGESYDYYRGPLGRHPRSTGWGLIRFDVFAHFTPFRNMEWIAPRPLLMVAGTEADTRHFSEDAVARAGDPAELYDIEGASHMDLYYRDEFIPQVVDKLVDFYGIHLQS